MNDNKGVREILDAIKTGFEFHDAEIKYHPGGEEWIAIDLKSKDYISHCQLLRIAEVCEKYNLIYFIVNRGRFFKKNILILKELDKVKEK
jgi:hypothetical protein